MKRKSYYGFLIAFLFVVHLFSTSSGLDSLLSESLVPSKLKVYACPPKITADKGVYDSIMVQLQNSKGLPVRAPEDIVISLSSSKTDIGSVDPKLTIPSGNTYAIAKFYSTYTPGSTKITAVSSGYTSEQVSVTTVAPTPSKLEVYCLPQILPADGKAYDSIMVQLQDSGGRPARAPIGDIDVTLTSSNIEVGTVDPSLTIKSGNTYAIAKFYTTTFAFSTTITAVTSGYASGQAKMITSEIGEVPSRLKVYVGPPKIMAEGAVHESISIQLQDSDSKVVKAPSNIQVILTSSNIAVGTVEPSVTISSGNTYTVTKFYSTYRSGRTTVTAVASGFSSGESSINTVGPIPSKIAVYGFPPVVPADNEAYWIMVQLQDSGGNPARDPIGDVSITLSSSNIEIGDVNPKTVISYGDTYSTTEFYSSYKAGSVTITALAPDYTSGKITMKTYVIDPSLTVSVTADPASIDSAEQTTISVYVTHNTLTPPLPVSDATIELTSDNGGSFSSITDEGNGSYTAGFIAPTVEKETICIITVAASKSKFASGRGQVQVTINLPRVGGDILVYVEESNGNPVSQATITSTSQPSGQSPLDGMTNNTGYVAFNSVTVGYYIIEVNKEGYETNSQLVKVIDGQTAKAIIYLPQAQTSDFTIPIIGVSVVALIVGVVIIIVLVKRRKREVGIQYPHGF